MTYFQQIDAWLEEMYQTYGLKAALHPDDWDDMKKAVKARILESYRNGQSAGPRPAAAKTKRSESRQPADRPRRSDRTNRKR